MSLHRVCGGLLFLVLGFDIAGAEKEAVLRIDKDTGGEIEGSLRADGVVVTFESRLDGAERVTVRVDVNGMDLDAHADLESDSRYLDGHGQALSADGRRALTTLTAELEGYLRPQDHELPIQADLLLRSVSYWSEAPVGWPLHYREVTKPNVGMTRPVAAKLIPRGEAAGGETWTACSSTGCQRSDNDGIGYIACGYGSNYGVWHDSAQHCFCRETRPLGCNRAAQCPGRCGPGCGLFGGWGIYGLDCAEHDRCCEVHGGCLSPLDASCGDEYNEAADDFLFGWPNCGSC